MKYRIATIILGAATLIAPALAQQSPSPFPLPTPVEKELAARAANVTEVTLGKDMLGFASKFMDKNDKDQAGVQQLIQGLDGIYVRDYEFDKEGQYSPDQLEQLRQAFQAPEWTPMVHEHNKKTGVTSDVMVKLVNGESNGMFILDVEPKEVSIVLILGTIHMDDLGKLKGISGLDALGDVSKMPGVKDKEKTSEKTKVKSGENE